MVARFRGGEGGESLLSTGERLPLPLAVQTERGCDMKRWMMMALLLAPMAAHAMPAVTKGGNVACISEQWYKDMVAFVEAKDRQSFQRYIDMKRCVVVKEGLRVTVTDSPGMFGGITGFIFQGTRFWTAREALNYNP